MKKNFLKFFLVFFFLLNSAYLAESKNRTLKIGAILPLSGKHGNLGNNILKTFELAIFELKNLNIEILPFDNQSNKAGTQFAFQELQNENIDIVVGPVFIENILEISKNKNFSKYTFISLTNDINNVPYNVISFGINLDSQINAIKEILKQKNKNKIFFSKKNQFSKKVLNKSTDENINFYKTYFYKNFQEIDKQAQIATSYWWRNKKLLNLIKTLKNSKNSDDIAKLKSLEKLDTLGGVNYQKVFIPEFDNNLISIISFFDYYDVNYKSTQFITLNQWFNKKLLIEPSLTNLIFPSINLKNFEELNEKFIKNYNLKIANIEILAYDIVPLIASIWFSRKEKKISINDFIGKEFKGKSGRFKINKKNATERRLDLYQIKENKFILLNSN